MPQPGEDHQGRFMAILGGQGRRHYFRGSKQIIGPKKPLLIPQLVGVFVLAADKYGDDKFFVLEWSKVQDILIANHRRWLDAHGGVRPRKPESLHCSLVEQDLRDHKDNRSIISSRL